MWLDFFICVAIGLVVVFLPGYLVCRALRQTPISSISFAPLVTVAVYAGCGSVYPFLGIASSWTTTFLPLLIVGAVALLASTLIAGRYGKGNDRAEQQRPTRQERLIFVGYILFGVLFTGFIFVRALNGADGFSVEIDNRFHYGLIRDFLVSGNWSSLSASDQASFYPSAMHSIASLIGTMFSTKVAILSNATLTLFIAFVFPAGMHAFMRRVFAENNMPIIFGMLVSFCFGAFPWHPLGYGPMTPFLLSVCLLPALSSAAMDVIAHGVDLKKRLLSLSICGFGLLAGVLMQTSVLFALLVGMLPFTISQVATCHEGKLGTASRKAKIAVITCVTVAFVGLWVFALNASFMQGVINYPWAPIATSIWDGLAQTVLFGQQAASVQITLGVLVLIGLVMATMKPKIRWVIFPYLFMAISYFVVATFNTPLEKVLAGFWYTDPIRVAANQCFFAIPLASLALGNIAQAVNAKLPKKHSRSSWVPIAVEAGVGLVLLVMVFMPYHYVPWKGIEPTAFGLGGVRHGLAWEYSTEDDRRYTAEESAFAQKVAAITGNDVVLNNPYDGSCFAWGIDGVRIAYSDRRLAYDYALGEKSIVGHLSDYASNEAIRKAVEDIGARYVLQLDPGKYMQDYLGDKDFEGHGREYPYVWSGIDAIDENTPGFKLVLREGNMSLYEIEDLS